MANTRVASRYAKALLGLASERGNIDVVEKELKLILSLVESSREFELLLISPVVKSDKKKKILDIIFKEGLTDITFGFIKLLVSKGREGLIPEIISEAIAQIRISKNIQAATVKTATPLGDDSRKKILAQVAKLHSGDIELTETIDPSLLGGFILRMDDKEIDASIKRQINTLRRKLTEHDYEPEL